MDACSGLPRLAAPLAGGPRAVVDYGCRDRDASPRDPAGIRPLHHDRVHDGRPRRASRSPGRSPRTTARGTRASTSPPASATRRRPTTPARNPKVALLFSDPTGSGIDDPPQVLVQGTARRRRRDLDANRERYRRESVEKLPAAAAHAAAQAAAAACSTGTSRASTCTSVPSASTSGRRATARSRARAVRRAHGGGALGPRRGARRRRTPAPRAASPCGTSAWTSSGERYPHGRGVAGRAGRLPVLGAPSDRGGPRRRRLRLGGAPLGVPWQPGLACVTAHDHAPDFTWQRNFQVRGDLVEDGRSLGADPAPAGGRLRAAPGLEPRPLPDEREEGAAIPEDRPSRR